MIHKIICCKTFFLLSKYLAIADQSNLQNLLQFNPIQYLHVESFAACLKFFFLLFLQTVSNICCKLAQVGFIYTFWYSLSSTSSILENGCQSAHHLQMTSSEGFQQHFSCLLAFLHEKECSFYTYLFWCTEMR